MVTIVQSLVTLAVVRKLIRSMLRLIVFRVDVSKSVIRIGKDVVISVNRNVILVVPVP